MTRPSGTASATAQVVAAKIATINQTVSTSGTVAAAHEADLDFESSGRVTAIEVAVGEKVRKGQVIATIGAAALRASLDSARANLAAAEASVSEASGGSSTEIAAAHSALVAAESQLSTARNALRHARLRATIRGTVTSLDLTRGQAVSATSAADSSDPQVVIRSSKTFVVNATVDDTEVKSVKKGQHVDVTPDGATQSVAGTVMKVSAIPDTSSSVVAFPVVVAVSGHPSGVYAGATATAEITTKHVSDVLEIPTLAITYDGSAASVKVRVGGSTATRTITVGTSYGLETQVLSGLTAGENVVMTIPTFGGPRSNSPGTTNEGNLPGGSQTFGGPSGGTFPSGTGPGSFSGQG
jgi:multidrug efflux pump subunit AcrA (membrane-fusion protein)